jgi:hypothetical protein
MRVSVAAEDVEVALFYLSLQMSATGKPQPDGSGTSVPTALIDLYIRWSRLLGKTLSPKLDEWATANKIGE